MIGFMPPAPSGRSTDPPHRWMGGSTSPSGGGGATSLDDPASNHFGATGESNRPARDACSVTTAVSSSTSSGGSAHAVTSFLPSLYQLMRDLQELVERRTTDGAVLEVVMTADVVAVAGNNGRWRFLSLAAEGLPDAAAALVSACHALDNLLCDIMSTPLPRAQPRRAQRVAIQSRLQTLLAGVTDARVKLEDALNELTMFIADTEDAPTLNEQGSGGDLAGSPMSSSSSPTAPASANALSVQKVHQATEALYAIFHERICAAELLLSANVALSLRTPDVVNMCARHVEEADAAVLERLKGDVCRSDDAGGPVRAAQLIDGVGVMSAALVEFARFSASIAAHAQRDEDRFPAGDESQRFAAFCAGVAARLSRCGLENAGIWVEEQAGTSCGVQAKSLAKAACASSAAPQAQRRQQPRAAAAFAAEEFVFEIKDIVQNASSGARLSSSVASSALVEQLRTAAARLFDVIGRVNMFLRRQGLVRDVAVDSASGKALPTAIQDDAMKSYLPHDLLEGVWEQRHAAAYDEACFRHDVLREQSAVLSELEEALSLPDEQFVRAAQDDLFNSMFARADECGLACGTLRTTVTRRVDALFSLRVKVFHHMGDVRSVTVSHRVPLASVLDTFHPWFHDLRLCKLSYLDEDGDRVALSSQAEYEGLLRRLRRSYLISGPDSASAVWAGSSLSRSSSSARGGLSGSSGATVDVKLELFSELLDVASSRPARVTKTAAAAGPSRTLPPQFDVRKALGDAKREEQRMQRHLSATTSVTSGRPLGRDEATEVRGGRAQPIGGTAEHASGGLFLGVQQPTVPSTATAARGSGGDDMLRDIDFIARRARSLLGDSAVADALAPAPPPCAPKTREMVAAAGRQHRTEATMRPVPPPSIGTAPPGTPSRPAHEVPSILSPRVTVQPNGQRPQWQMPSGLDGLRLARHSDDEGGPHTGRGGGGPHAMSPPFRGSAAGRGGHQRQRRKQGFDAVTLSDEDEDGC